MAGQKTIHTINGLDMDVLQETIGKIEREPELGKCKFRAKNRWIKGDHNRNTVSDFYCAGEEMTHKRTFVIEADEPTMLAGEDSFTNPVEHLLCALASCITTSMVAHAATKGIHIEELESQVEGDIDLRGFLGLSEYAAKGFTNIRIRFLCKSDADEESLKKLAEFSPVYNTLTNGVKVDIEVESV